MDAEESIIFTWLFTFHSCRSTVFLQPEGWTRWACVNPVHLLGWSRNNSAHPPCWALVALLCSWGPDTCHNACGVGEEEAKQFKPQPDKTPPAYLVKNNKHNNQTTITGSGELIPRRNSQVSNACSVILSPSQTLKWIKEGKKAKQKLRRFKWNMYF